jgi:hypothetical protein
MGGNTVTGVANAAPELVARLVYRCAYCCIESPSLPAYAPNPGAAADVLTRTREVVWIGEPARTRAA